MEFLHVIELILICWSLLRIGQLQRQINFLQADIKAEDRKASDDWKPVDLSDEREFDLEQIEKRRAAV